MPNAPKIFVVEDDRFLSKAYQAKLGKEGMEIAVALDGEQALILLPQVKPDVVLLDLMLPLKNGFTVLEAMKKDPALKDIPVIILSNLGQDSDIERGKALGAVDYIVKTNVKLDAVVQKIKEILAKYASDKIIHITLFFFFGARKRGKAKTSDE